MNRGPPKPGQPYNFTSREQGAVLITVELFAAALFEADRDVRLTAPGLRRGKWLGGDSHWRQPAESSSRPADGAC